MSIFQGNNMSPKDIISISLSWAKHFLSTHKEEKEFQLKQFSVCPTPGYNRFLGDCSAATAKLWDLLDGLLILQKQGYDKAIIRSDNLENVISINDSKSGVSNNSLIKRIQQILALEDNWSLIYVPRETNCVADALAKMTQPNDETLRIYEEPPLKIKENLKEDRFVDSFTLNHPI
ncbi:hypothetical protein J1N35_018005 [Gossypium stocksii]|uniref:RNase H type-1 domain-containing protein n=1 Tax=Gossypium stocksii TaxID=47602 RepID=A0A9D3VQ14_9ROSI|nr:hypothetical protein J1N35_018005 [Gossypium stocksii]